MPKSTHLRAGMVVHFSKRIVQHTCCFSKLRTRQFCVYFTYLRRKKKSDSSQNRPSMMSWLSIFIVTVMIISLSAKPTMSDFISVPFSSHHIPAVTGAGVSLLGGAHFVGDGDSIQLSRSTPSSFGIILRSTPFNFTSSTSFSSNITFEIGNGFSLVIIPTDFSSKFARNMSIGLLNANRFLGIEFDVNVCTISSSRVSNVSKINHGLEDGMKLTSWIDYRAILQRLDVRLSKLGDPKPVKALISHHIDLGEILKGEEVLFGLASTNENHEQITTVYSWTSEVKDVPKWVHSIPVIPKDYVQTSKKKSCFLRGFVIATGCGALAALILFFTWSYVADRQKLQGEASVLPVDFKYEKIGVLEVKNSEPALK